MKYTYIFVMTLLLLVKTGYCLFHPLASVIHLGADSVFVYDETHLLKSITVNTIEGSQIVGREYDKNNNLLCYYISNINGIPLLIKQYDINGDISARDSCVSSLPGYEYLLSRWLPGLDSSPPAILSINSIYAKLTIGDSIFLEDSIDNTGGIGTKFNWSVSDTLGFHHVERIENGIVVESIDFDSLYLQRQHYYRESNNYTSRYIFSYDSLERIIEVTQIAGFGALDTINSFYEYKNIESAVKPVHNYPSQFNKSIRFSNSFDLLGRICNRQVAPNISISPKGKEVSLRERARRK